jgi:hypothetical protein
LDIDYRLEGVGAEATLAAVPDRYASTPYGQNVSTYSNKDAIMSHKERLFESYSERVAPSSFFLGEAECSRDAQRTTFDVVALGFEEAQGIEGSELFLNTRVSPIRPTRVPN